MLDARNYTLAGSIVTAQYSLTVTPVLLSTIVGALPSTLSILDVEVLAQVTAGTDRGAVLFGGTDATMYGYIPASVSRIFPVHEGNVYIASASGTINIVVSANIGAST